MRYWSRAFFCLNLGIFISNLKLDMNHKPTPPHLASTAKLQELGLSPSEAALYLAGLTSPGASARELGQRANLKRPTAYYALDQLTRRGLVAATGTERKQRYTMADPSALERLLDAKISALEASRTGLTDWLNTLRTSAPSQASGFESLVYEGEAGLKTALDAALYCRTPTWDVIAPYQNPIRTLPRKDQLAYLQTREARHIRTRLLWEGSPHRTLLDKEKRGLREPRYLPKPLHGTFTSMLILFDQSALILSQETGPTAILIRSAAIHGLLKAAFEGLWSISTTTY